MYKANVYNASLALAHVSRVSDDRLVEGDDSRLLDFQ